LTYSIGDHDDTSRVCFYGCADIPSESIEPLCRFGTCGDLFMRCYLQGVVMPRRKKKFMLLRGKMGNFIVVERRWYDFAGIARVQGKHKMWWIAAQDDDSEMLNAMASLTDKHVKMGVYHEQDGVVTRRE
jgi:hypothetical protein